MDIVVIYPGGDDKEVMYSEDWIKRQIANNDHFSLLMVRRYIQTSL